MRCVSSVSSPSLTLNLPPAPPWECNLRNSVPAAWRARNLVVSASVLLWSLSFPASRRRRSPPPASTSHLCSALLGVTSPCGRLSAQRPVSRGWNTCSWAGPRDSSLPSFRRFPVPQTCFPGGGLSFFLSVLFLPPFPLLLPPPVSVLTFRVCGSIPPHAHLGAQAARGWCPPVWGLTML